MKKTILKIINALKAASKNKKTRTLATQAGINLIIAAILVGLYFFTVPVSIATVFAPIYKGDTTLKNVGLMINVYEGADQVKEMLEIFDRSGVTCTFFIGGCWADDNMELVKEISEKHEIGNHGYFHKDHDKLSREQNAQEINTAEKVIFAASGIRTHLFAPPSGAFSDVTLAVAKELDYKVIMWSVDTIDWRDHDENLVFKRATNVTGGDLVLMHPKAHTVKALPSILEIYKQKGLSAVTVSECLSEEVV